MLGLTIIRKSTLETLKRQDVRVMMVIQCQRWFSGWMDLDIIWDYIMSETYFGDISSCRAKYAKARGTDEYGKKAGDDGKIESTD